MDRQTSTGLRVEPFSSLSEDDWSEFVKSVVRESFDYDEMDLPPAVVALPNHAVLAQLEPSLRVQPTDSASVFTIVGRTLPLRNPLRGRIRAGFDTALTEAGRCTREGSLLVLSRTVHFADAVRGVCMRKTLAGLLERPDLPDDLSIRIRRLQIIARQ